MTLHLSVDRPLEHEHVVVHEHFLVEGWAWSSAGPCEVRMTYAGREGVVREGEHRLDVSTALGIGPHRGYLASGATTGLPAGPLEVVVTARGPDGETTERTRVLHVADQTGPTGHRPRPFTGSPERLDPRLAPGSLTHAEHVARYRWIAPLAGGRDVLDAGCGVGYGSAMLAAAGARSVTGVDAFAAAVLEAREQDRHGASFLVGDLCDLTLDDDSVDLVVCFEVIEHIRDHDRLLAELRRVLRPDGVLAVSTPTPGAIAVHNPHHVHEISGEELERLLRGTFAEVRTLPQYSAIASVIGPRLAVPHAPPMGWATGPVDEMYRLALAADGPLPELEPLGILGSGMDVATLVSHFYETQDSILRLQAEAAAQRARADRAEYALEALEATHEDLRELARVTHASQSWRLTAPLREAAAVLRDARGRRR